MRDAGPPDGEAGPLVGYAPGAYDLFHVGHLNLLRRARLQCDVLVAGVVPDEVALEQKGRLPVVPQEERLAIVAAVDVVDRAEIEWSGDKLLAWQRIGFDVVFKGDDWATSPLWAGLEREFARRGVRTVYLPYTRHVSTSLLRARLHERAGV